MFFTVKGPNTEGGHGPTPPANQRLRENYPKPPEWAVDELLDTNQCCGPVPVGRSACSFLVMDFHAKDGCEYGAGMKPILQLGILGLVFAFLNLFGSCSEAQETMLQVLEPGIGYARFKHWAVDNQLVFENFTKDSLVVRDTGLRQWETIRIQARFCGGDDYSGKASNTISTAG